MISVGDLLTSVSLQLGDPNRQRWSAGMLVEYINIVLRDVTLRHAVLHNNTAVSITSSNRVDVVYEEELNVITSVILRDANTWEVKQHNLPIWTYSKFLKQTKGNPSQTKSDDIVCLYHAPDKPLGQFIIYPTPINPSDFYVEFNFNTLHTEVSEWEDIDLDNVYINAIMNGVKVEAYLANQDTQAIQLAEIHRVRYEREMKRLSVRNTLNLVDTERRTNYNGGITE